MQLHRVFHVSLLEKASGPSPNPVVVEVTSKSTTIPKAILHTRLKKILQYLVQFEGQSMSDATWQSSVVLKDYGPMVREFHETYSDLP
jgi:hypothetical protein